MRAIFIALLLLGICARTGSLHAGPGATIDHIPGALLEMIAKAPSGCERDILYTFRQASLGNDVSVLTAGLRYKGCLDAYSRIESTPDQLEDPELYTEKRMDILYLYISAFGKTTADKVRVQLAAARPFSKILLDLRWNGGGILGRPSSEDREGLGVLGVAELFAPLAAAPLITPFVPNKVGVRSVVYRARARGPYADIPVAVLVDKHTASASEILAGALLLWYEDTLHIVGERTYGKGVFTNVSRASGVDVVLTGGGFVVGQIGGRSLSIQGNGIRPTILVADPTPPLTPLEPRYDPAAEIGLWVLGDTSDYSTGGHPLSSPWVR